MKEVWSLKNPAKNATPAVILNVNMPIYTRTGDTGQTSLFGGKRVLKCEELVDVYGSLDELNSWLGNLVSKLTIVDAQQFLQSIQEDLFVIGSALTGWKGMKPEKLNKKVQAMEARIDLMEKELPAIKNFILPGGTELGSMIHIARSICRRIERQVVALQQGVKINPVMIKYLNRLSDFLFVLARFINKQENAPELFWLTK